MKVVAQEVVNQFNGRGYDLARKGDPYSAYRLVRIPLTKPGKT